MKIKGESVDFSSLINWLVDPTNNEEYDSPRFRKFLEIVSKNIK